MPAQKPIWLVNDIKVSFFKPNGNGLIISIDGQIPSNEFYIHFANMTLDVSGDIWGILGDVEDYLPLSLEQHVHSEDISPDGFFHVVIYFGTKTRSTFGVSHSTIKTKLAAAIQAGNPTFALNFFYGGEFLLSIPTNPVLISNAIKNHSSALQRNQLPFFPRINLYSHYLFTIIRWLFFPALFVGMTWWLLISPSILQTYLPVLTWLSSSSNTTFMELLPPMPQSRSQAWNLAHLDSELSVAEHASQSDTLQDILVRAANIVGRSSVSAEELHSMYSRIVELESHQGIYARVTGIFTFVNFIWLIAILGICISIVPAVYAFAPFLKRMLWFLWNEAIKPVVMLLHRLGVFEALFYVLCTLIVVDGSRRPAEWGFFISLTGLGLSIPCFLYSTSLHRVKHFFGNRSSTLNQFICTWIAICWIPMAILFHSTLLAFGAVIAMYSALGFSVVCTGLCYYIGFEGDNQIKRVATASALLLAAFSLLRIFQIQAEQVEIFSCPVQVFGALTLLLALLIISSYNYGSNRNSNRWLLCQILMISTLIVTLFIGNVWGITSMTNTGYVFCALYLIEKYLDVHVDKNWNVWVLVLLGSIALWRMALYVHTHPGFVSAIFSGF